MRLTNLFLSLTVMTVALVGQDIQLPDGNVVQGGASNAQRLPPPPPPPALPGTPATTGAQTGAAVQSSTSVQTATEGDDTVQKATAAMKLMGADPAKDRELFEKLVATIQANRKSADGAATQIQTGAQGAASAQGAAVPQDAGAQSAARSGSSTTSTQAQQIQPVQAAQQQQVAGGSQALVQGSTSFDSSYSSCSACATTYVPTCTSYVVPTYVTYPRYYVSSCSYPVFRTYPTVFFRGFASFGGHHRR